MINILSIKNCIPVNVFCQDEETGEERIVFTLLDHFAKTLEIPNEEDLNFVKNVEEFQESVFAYYNKVLHHEVEIPEAVYDAYKKVVRERQKAQDIAEKEKKNGSKFQSRTQSTTTEETN